MANLTIFAFLTDSTLTHLNKVYLGIINLINEKTA